MDLSDRRVVQFREWAEKRFAIGSGGYPQAEDLLSVVMKAVDERLGMVKDDAHSVRQSEIEKIAAKTGEDPAFLEWLKGQE